MLEAIVFVVAYALVIAGAFGVFDEIRRDREWNRMVKKLAADQRQIEREANAEMRRRWWQHAGRATASWLKRSTLTAIAITAITLAGGVASARAQWRPAWKAARIMPEVPREYARWEPVRASDLGPPFSRWRPIRWLPTPK